jgi:hypothetical protein
MGVRSEVSLRMPYVTMRGPMARPSRLSKEGSPLLTLEGQRSVFVCHLWPMLHVSISDISSIRALNPFIARHIYRSVLLSRLRPYILIAPPLRYR